MLYVFALPDEHERGRLHRAASSPSLLALASRRLREPARRPAPATLRVCADPNNLPFSNERREGFENQIARAGRRGSCARRVEYTWWAQRRGFVRNTLNAGACDVVMGVPAGFEMARARRARTTARPTCSSRARTAHSASRSFDDPRCARLRIGVQLIGDDFANTPPAHALARRGIVDNVVGYTRLRRLLASRIRRRAIVDAVARGDVDVAVVWGPLAGYFAPRDAVPLDVTPVAPRARPAVPAVRLRHRDGRAAAATTTLARRARRDHRAAPSRDRSRSSIDYGVPRVPADRCGTRAGGDCRCARDPAPSCCVVRSSPAAWPPASARSAASGEPPPAATAATRSR